MSYFACKTLIGIAKIDAAPHHCQWIFPLAYFSELGGQYGFEQAGMFESQTQKPGDEQSDRIHFILRKDES